MTNLICPECRIGRCQPTTAPYMQWVGERMIMVPNAPAFTCDVCRYTYYEDAFLQRMEYLVEKLTQPVRPASAKRHSAARGKRAEWLPGRSSG